MATGGYPITPPPAIFEVIENASIPGSGSFVVDRGTGRPEVIQSPHDRWWKFSTLGDGQGGNYIRLSSGQADLYNQQGERLQTAVGAVDLRTLEEHLNDLF